VEQIEYPALKVAERFESAKEFLRLGKDEIADGRARANSQLERQGAEKVFHALEEACTALAEKYGLKPPQDHDSIRDALQFKGETRILTTFEEAYLILHTATYYKSWINRKAVDEQVKRVEIVMEGIRNKLRQR